MKKPVFFYLLCIFISGLMITTCAYAQNSNAEILYNAGKADQQEGNIEQAIIEFQGAVNSDANYHRARLALAWCYVQQGNVEKAINHFNEIVKRAPDSSEGKEAKKVLSRLEGEKTVVNNIENKETKTAKPIDSKALKSSLNKASPKKSNTIKQKHNLKPLPKWTWITSIILVFICLIITSNIGLNAINILIYSFWFPINFFLISAMFTVYPTADAWRISLVFGGLNGVIAGIVGLIPLVGPIIYWFVATHWIIPAFYHWYPSISPSWITQVIYWNSFICAIILSISSILNLSRSQE